VGVVDDLHHRSTRGFAIFVGPTWQTTYHVPRLSTGQYPPPLPRSSRYKCFLVGPLTHDGNCATSSPFFLLGVLLLMSPSSHLPSPPGLPPPPPPPSPPPLSPATAHLTLPTAHPPPHLISACPTPPPNLNPPIGRNPTEQGTSSCSRLIVFVELGIPPPSLWCEWHLSGCEYNLSWTN
jgi:hypothetical protein